MSGRDDSGPAFPQPCTSDGHTANSPYGMAGGGMSLRDYFAAAALTGILVADEIARQDVNPGGDPSTAPEVARSAYMLADAMLKAREGGAS